MSLINNIDIIFYWIIGNVLILFCDEYYYVLNE